MSTILRTVYLAEVMMGDYATINAHYEEYGEVRRVHKRVHVILAASIIQYCHDIHALKFNGFAHARNLSLK